MLPKHKIYEIPEMLAYLDDFFDNPKSRHSIAVGGIEGSFIFKHVMDSALNRHHFEDILIVEGCQDYVGLNKNKLLNHVYYVDMFIDEPKSFDGVWDCLKPKMYAPNVLYERRVKSKYKKYPLVVVANAHLIPFPMINELIHSMYGSIVLIGDPYDLGGEAFMQYPILTDSLHKLSPMQAYARSLYQVETRAINKKAGGGITDTKLGRRSIGKLDNRQYVTKDPELIEEIRMKQIQSQFRKNQKILVKSNRIQMNLSTDNPCQVFDNSMLLVTQTSMKKVMVSRIYNTKEMFYGSITYARLKDPHWIQVVPANILSIEESRHHRYKHIHLVLTNDYQLSVREKYSLVKNTDSMSVSHQ